MAALKISRNAASAGLSADLRQATHKGIGADFGVIGRMTTCERFKLRTQRGTRETRRLDIAFNNAGTEGQMGLTTDTQTAEHYQSVFDINVKGTLLSMKHEAAAMLRNGGGSIVNTSSIAGHIGLAGAGVYVASKHAVNGLSKSAALEFAKKGIRVNTVSPGTIQTEMIRRMLGDGESDAKKWWENQHPVGRFGFPEEVAAAVVWLASPEASFVTGTDIAVDGGYMAQ